MCYYRHCTNVTEFLICYMHAQLLIASDSATPQTVAHQAPLSVGFPRQEYWSGLPFYPPRASSWFRDQTHVSCTSCIGKQILNHCITWEALPNLLYLNENSYLEGRLLQFPCKNKIPPSSTPWGINLHHTFLKFARNTGQVVNEAINYTMSEVLNITLFSWPCG